jgi:CheY-like chemotaxis protein
MDKKTILFVGDDQAFVDGGRKALESKGHRVDAASSLEEGYRKLGEARPDLVIVDMIIGKRADGICFARKLRRSPAFQAYAGVPILMVTGLREQGDASFPVPSKNAYRLPVDELLEKPVSPEALLEKAEGLLRI